MWGLIQSQASLGIWYWCTNIGRLVLRVPHRWGGLVGGLSNLGHLSPTWEKASSNQSRSLSEVSNNLYLSSTLRIRTWSGSSWGPLTWGPYWHEINLVSHFGEQFPVKKGVVTIWDNHERGRYQVQTQIN